MERKRVAGRFVRQGLDGDGGAQAAGAKDKKAPQPKACKRFTLARMAEALPDIVGRFVEEAKNGSIAHAKMLAELGGLDKIVAPEIKRRRGKSVVGQLLENLAKQPE